MTNSAYGVGTTSDTFLIGTKCPREHTWWSARCVSEKTLRRDKLMLSSEVALKTQRTRSLIIDFQLFSFEYKDQVYLRKTVTNRVVLKKKCIK